MSTMWNCRVVNRGGDWVDVHVEQAHPDAGHFPMDAVFALLLLAQVAFDSLDDLEESTHRGLAEILNYENSYLPARAAPYVPEIIEDVNIIEAANIPWNEAAVHDAIDALCRRAGLRKEDEGWDAAWAQYWDDFWEDPAKLPRAVYRIFVKKAEYINHMKLGLHFRSTAFCEPGPRLEKNIALPNATLPSDAQGRPGILGFNGSEVPPRASNMDAALIRSTALKHVLDPATISSLLSDHERFLEEVGGGGEWERFEAAGLPLNKYDGRDDARRLILSLKTVPASVSLNGRDLAYADLSGAILENVELSGAEFEGALLSDGFFAGANFENASLCNVDFTGSDLRSAIFRNCNLSGANFENTDCTGADFTGARIRSATFVGAKLDEAKS